MMKTQKLTPGIKYNTSEKNYIKSTMYEFDRNEEILVEEKQDNGTCDRILLCYNIGKGEKAYFSEEYLPYGMKKEGVKKPDITAIVENSHEKEIKWFIYDIKDTVINANTAVKLCSQWHSGIEHISMGYLDQLPDYHVNSSLGVITRYWDKERLGKEMEDYRKKIESLQIGNLLLTARKGKINVREYEGKIEAMQNIVNEQFIEYDELTKNKKVYSINYIMLNTEDSITYSACMDICL